VYHHQRQNSTTKQYPQTSSPSNDIPILTRWTLNSNNTITGYISNSSTIKDGNKITTSVITGSTNGGSIVETKSNSKYYLSVSTVVPKRQGRGIIRSSSYIPSSDVSVASSLSSAASSVQSRAYQAIRGGSESTARKFFKLPPKIRKLILFSLLILIATLVTQNLQREMQSFNINTTELSSIDRPISICDRMAPLSHEDDIRITQKYNSQCMMNKSPPQNTTLLLLGSEKSTWGRTGNNLIEFLHAMQYAKDNNMIVGIMQVSWPTYMITQMWMSIQTNVRNRGTPECVDDGTIQSARACDRAIVRSKQRVQAIDEWITLFESSFCIKILNEEDDLSQYEQVVTLSTKDLFEYQHEYTVTATDNSGFTDYVEYQSHIIRTLFKHYNNGIGINMHNEPVGDMCSVLNAMFGKDKDTIMYSVIHSRSLEGLPGQRMLAKIAERSGCDPMAALDMNPHYVKSVLKPAGMLGYPIIFITDNQRPEILQKLLEDVQLGPHIRLIPEEASWLGGDITIAIMSTIFIGNPASTLSGFIAKSRVALGYKTNYLFRRKVDEGTQWYEGKWFNVCDHECIFNKNVMRSMA